MKAQKEGEKNETKLSSPFELFFVLIFVFYSFDLCYLLLSSHCLFVYYCYCRCHRFSLGFFRVLINLQSAHRVCFVQLNYYFNLNFYPICKSIIRRIQLQLQLHVSDRNFSMEYCIDGKNGTNKRVKSNKQDENVVIVSQRKCSCIFFFSFIFCSVFVFLFFTLAWAYFYRWQSVKEKWNLFFRCTQDQLVNSFLQYLQKFDTSFNCNEPMNVYHCKVSKWACNPWTFFYKHHSNFIYIVKQYCRIASVLHPYSVINYQLWMMKYMFTLSQVDRIFQIVLNRFSMLVII